MIQMILYIRGNQCSGSKMFLKLTTLIFIPSEQPPEAKAGLSPSHKGKKE